MKVTLILPAIGKKTGQKYLRSWLMEPLTVAVLNAMIPDRYERVFFDDRIERIDYEIETDVVLMTVETYTAKRAYYIAEQFQNPIGSLDIAEHFSVSRSKLDRDFKRFTGITPRQFIEFCRINHAKILLGRKESLSIREIAEKCGFAACGAAGATTIAKELGVGLDKLVELSKQLDAALEGDCSAILPTLAELRKAVDGLELIVSDSRWPLPKYREMLFIY